MARPTKQGLDYFPMDTEFDDDTKLFITEMGADALAVLAILWQIIYSNEGYYVKYDRKLPAKVKQRLGTEIDRTKEIIEASFEYEIFDLGIYKKYKILTSAGIQKRYLIGARLKKNIIFIPEIMLVDVSNVRNCTYIGINDVGNPRNLVGNATNVNVNVKVKEKEEVKVNGNKNSPTDLKEFSEIQNLWIQTFGRSPKIPEIDETKKLIEKHGMQKVNEIYRQASLKGFKNLGTLIDSLDDKGNIKPRAPTGRNNAQQPEIMEIKKHKSVWDE